MKYFIQALKLDFELFKLKHIIKSKLVATSNEGTVGSWDVYINKNDQEAFEDKWQDGYSYSIISGPE